MASQQADRAHDRQQLQLTAPPDSQNPEATTEPKCAAGNIEQWR